VVKGLLTSRAKDVGLFSSCKPFLFANQLRNPLTATPLDAD
jgi:hypothetical protein